MIENRVQRGIPVLGFACTFWLILHALAQSGALEITFFDVGQADAVLVICPDGEHTMLIDTGDTRYPGSKQAFRSQIASAFADRDNRIDVVVASHPHADHIGSMLWVLEMFDVGVYVDSGAKADTAIFGELEVKRRRLVRQGRLVYVNAKQSSPAKLDFCPDGEVTLITPWSHGRLSHMNDRSVLIRLDFLDRSFLFMGDLEEKGEKLLLRVFDEDQRQLLNVDLLKVGHHGSDTSSSADFLNLVSPEFAVISAGRRDVGTNSRYRHPRFSTIDRFGMWFRNRPPPMEAPSRRIWAYDAEGKRWRSVGRPAGLYLTPVDGTIRVRWDGSDWEIN